MTLGNDTGHFHPSPPRKSYNPFDSDDDIVDSSALKPGNAYTQQDHKVNDQKPVEKGPVADTFLAENVNLSWEEAIFGQTVVNACSNGHSSLFVQDGQMYTDKNVTDCESAEVVVCYKENQYQSVKDIGIDEGVPIHDKLWVQTCEEESMDSSSVLAISGKGHDANSKFMDFGPVDVHEIKDDASQARSTSLLKEDVLNGLKNQPQENDDEDPRKVTELKLDAEKQVSFPADWIQMEVQAAIGGFVYDVADSHPATETDPNTNSFEPKITELKLDAEKQASFPADWVQMEVQAATCGFVYDVVDSYPATETDPNTNSSERKLIFQHQEKEDQDSPKIMELKLDTEKQASFHADWVQMEVQAAAAVGLVYDGVDGKPATETDPNTKNSSKPELDLMDEDGPDHDDTKEKKGDDISQDEADDGGVQEPFTGETPSKVKTECEEVNVKPDEGPNEDKKNVNSSENVAVQESFYGNNPNETDSDDKLVTADSNSSTNSYLGSQEDEPPSLETETPPTSQSMVRYEEARPSISTLTGLEPKGFGETSFSSSASVPLPSSIIFMGPVSYSGNISLRSESSAGSTRSFAFPVLQNEWNSSPVRMAKADRRYFKKQRGWIEALFCCRF